MNRICCFFLVIFLSSALVTSGADQTSFSEKSIIHLPKQIYHKGELIWLKVYFVKSNNTLQSSNVGYVDLLNENGKIVKSIKLLIVDGAAFGDIKISEELTPGRYYLTAYTNLMKKGGAGNFNYTSVLIFDNYKQGFGASAEVKSNKSNGSLNIKIQPEKNEYALGETINYKISCTDNSGNPTYANLSVSVIKKDIKNLKGSEVNIIERGDKFINSDVENTLSVEGVVKDENGCPLGNIPLYFASSSDSGCYNVKFSNILKEDITKSDGSFKFNDFNFYGTKDVYFYSPGRNINVSIKKDLEGKVAFSSDTSHVKIDSAIASHLDLINQIRSEYQIVDTTTNYKFTNYYLNPFKGIKIILDDYYAFSTMEEVITEIIPKTYVRKQKGVYVIRLQDPINGVLFKQQPIFILDGVPVLDNAEIMKINPANVKSVTVSRPPQSTEQFGFNGINGAVIVETDKTVALKGLKINFDGYYEPHIFSVPNQKVPNLPDFRFIEYWNPDLKTDNQGLTTTSYLTSDEPGDFSVRVEGITKEGEWGYAELEYKVQSIK